MVSKRSSNNTFIKLKSSEPNQIITYTIKPGRNGRPRAIEAAFNEAPLVKTEPKKIKALTLIFPMFFMFCVGFMVLITEVSKYIFVYYLVLSLLSFLMYGADKDAAKGGSQRTPEIMLHFFSLIGGWPGALIGQQVFRHKTKKQSFLITYWITVIINCAGFIWFLTPEGQNITGNISRIIWDSLLTY